MGDLIAQWKLSRRERRSRSTYRKKMAESRAKGDKDGEEIWKQEWAETAFDIEEERRWLKDRRVRRIGDRLYIPLPPHSDDQYWEEAVMRPGAYFLTVKGMNDLLSRIRAERKARLEVWIALAPVIAALTGLLGALAGVLAVVSRR